MTTPLQDKYRLKSLHEEIDLFDRKLAHLLKFDAFPTEADRDVAVQKMTTKRNQLVRTARQMADDGVEFKASDLPRSFRTDEASASVESSAASLVESNTVTSIEFNLPNSTPLPLPARPSILNGRSRHTSGEKGKPRNSPVRQ